MKPKYVTTKTVLCPCCGNDTGILAIPNMASVKGSYCDVCGTSLMLTRKSNAGDIELIAFKLTPEMDGVLRAEEVSCYRCDVSERSEGVKEVASEPEWSNEVPMTPEFWYYEIGWTAPPKKVTIGIWSRQNWIERKIRKSRFMPITPVVEKVPAPPTK